MMALTSNSNCPSLIAKVVDDHRVENGCVGRCIHIDGASIGLVVAIEGDVVEDNCTILQDDGCLTKSCQVGEGAVHNGQLLIGD